MNYFQKAVELLKEKSVVWLENFVAFLPSLIVALLVLALFFLLAFLARRAIHKILEKTTTNEAINNFLSSLAAIFVFLFGFFVTLDIINLDKTFASLLAGAGILGLAFSLGFQDVVANFVSGVMIAARKPYKAGDLIETNGIFGKVIKINMRSTHLVTQQGQFAVVPNRLVYQNPLLNHSRLGKRRVELKAGVTYGSSLAEVEQTVIKAIRKLHFLHPGSEVEFFFREFGEYAITFEVRYWIKFTRQADYLKAVSEGIKIIKADFKEKGIIIPFPVRTIDFAKKEIVPDEFLHEKLKD
ncbi:MAG TPA: mechanosensitive ion channel family protein [Chitinophagales bacterium]|nr:mechanosensitive ion channel family protein [Chitinophagales bacterium]